MSTNGKIAYILSLYDYPAWPEERRSEVETWLQDLGIEPADVSVGDRAASLTIWRRRTGALELDIWLVERDEDGHGVACPSCPCCVRQKRVQVPVEEPVPSAFGARLEASKVAA
jgi:hypothetical protein